MKITRLLLADKRKLFNEALWKLSYKLKLTCVPSTPSHLEMELSNMCNLKCKMCPRSGMKRKIGIMKFEYFKKVIDEIGKNITLLWLHVFGEPLMTPDLLLKAISYAKSKGVKEVGISTNGILLNDKVARGLLNSKLDIIIIDVDAATKKTFEKLRKPAKYETLVKNLKNFFKLKKELKNKRLKVILQFIKMKENIDEMDKLADLWRDYDCEIHVKQFETWAGQINDNGIYESHGPRLSCPRLWNSLTVLWDGRVSICCRDVHGSVVVGDINKDNIKQIWNNKIMKNLRKNDNYEKIPFCKYCKEWYFEIKPNYEILR